jgi:hypothetical protein
MNTADHCSQTLDRELTMKGVVRDIAGAAFSTANWLIPKRDNEVVLTSYSDLVDNTRLLSVALAQMG